MVFLVSFGSLLPTEPWHARFFSVYGGLGCLMYFFFLRSSIVGSRLLVVVCSSNVVSVVSFASDKQAQYCEALAKKIKTISDLPDKCKDYDAVKEVLQKRKTVTDPFAGMTGATAARAMRSTGQESHAKIQRRMTTGATVGARRFSKLDKDS